MKTKLIIFLAAWLMCGQAYGAQVLLKTDAGPGQTRSINTELGVANSNFTELYNQAATHWASSGHTYTADIDSVTHGGKTYICTATHNSSDAGVAGNEPGVGGNWQDIWKVSGNGIFEPAQTAASQAEAEAGTESALRSFSPLRIKQAIDALGGSGSSTLGALTDISGTDTAGYILYADGDDTFSWGAAPSGTFPGFTDLSTDYGFDPDDKQNVADVVEGAVESPLIGEIATEGVNAGKFVISMTTDYYQPYDATLINKAAIDTQGKFEALLGWTISSAGTGFSISETVPTTSGQMVLKDSTHHLYITSTTGIIDWDLSSSFTAWDTAPTAYSFTDQTDVALSSTMTSDAITVAGINYPAAISVSGGTYDINASDSFTSSAGTVSVGDTVRARHTSSASNLTAVDTIVTIGGVSDTFSSTTLAATTYTFTWDIVDGNSTDKITYDSTDYIVDGSDSGLTSDATFTVTADTGREGVVTGTGVTDLGSNSYSVNTDSANVNATITFSDVSGVTTLYPSSGEFLNVTTYPVPDIDDYLVVSDSDNATYGYVTGDYKTFNPMFDGSSCTSISELTVHVIMSTSAGSLAFRFQAEGAQYATDITATTTPTEYSHKFLLNPSGGVAWTCGAISSLTAGTASRIIGGAELRTHEIWVTYE